MGLGKKGQGEGKRGRTPISASSRTVSRIVTLWSGFATLVEIAAERPARPAPMIIRWIDIFSFSLLKTR
jgi:hypothetical protein